MDMDTVQVLTEKHHVLPAPSIAGEGDYAFGVDHRTNRTTEEPDTIGDPEGAARRAEVNEKPQLPAFVTDDFTPRFNDQTKTWSLIPKPSLVSALETEIREIYAYQEEREDLQARAKKIVSSFEKILQATGQWTALDFVRSTVRNSARSMANGVRTSISAFNWASRLAEGDKDTADADNLTASANTQVEDSVVLILAATKAGENVLGGEADLQFSVIDWHRASRDALGLEGARHAKRYVEPLDPRKAVERKLTSAKAALGALKGQVAAAA